MPNPDPAAILSPDERPDGLVFAVRLTCPDGSSFVFGGRRPLAGWLQDYARSLLNAPSSVPTRTRRASRQVVTA